MRILTRRRWVEMDHPPEPEIVRRLGYLERIMATNYNMGLYNGTSVACQYAIPGYLRGPDQHVNLVNVFQRAVAEVVMRHPMCQVSLLNQGEKSPSWGKLDKINISRLVTWRTLHPAETYEKVRKQVLKSQLDKSFDLVESRPGWRMVVIRESPDSKTCEAFFVFNHANFDGISGKIFHQDLLRYLNNHLRRFRESGSSYYPSQPPLIRRDSVYLPPPVEEMSYFPASNLWMASMFWKKHCPSMFRRSQAPEWTTLWPRVDLEAPYETGLKTLVIPRDIIDSVLTVCRHNGNTTFTALLHVLTAVSLARQIPESEMPALKSVTTIDLRRYMPNPLRGEQPMYPSRTMANIVGRLTHKFDYSLLSEIRSIPSMIPPADDSASFVSSSSSSQPTADGNGNDDPSPPPPPPPKRKRGGEPLPRELKTLIWTKAAEVRGEIKARMDRGLENDEMSVMGWGEDWRASIKGTLHNTRASTFLISNLAAIDGEIPIYRPVHVRYHNNDQYGNGSGSGERSSAISTTCYVKEDNKYEQFAIRRASFTLGAHINDTGIHLGVVSVLGGDMVIDLTWHKGAVDDGVMKTLGEDLVAWLRSIAKAKDIDMRHHPNYMLPVGSMEQDA